jgi:hypothetical protein
MATKEWRETRGFALAALVLYGFVLSNKRDYFITNGSAVVPFVGDDFAQAVALISGALAIALGLRQTLGESLRGTYPFLLHRPAGRRWLIGVKLLVGLCVSLLCGAVAILVYAIWVSTPGTHAGPFRWSMTLPSWETCFRVTVLYLGAFLTGLRPGRWYRTRILPLATTLVVFVIVGWAAFGAEGGLIDTGISLWPWLAIFVADAWLITAILFTARTRDYP